MSANPRSPHPVSLDFVKEEKTVHGSDHPSVPSSPFSDDDTAVPNANDMFHQLLISNQYVHQQVAILQAELLTRGNPALTETIYQQSMVKLVNAEFQKLSCDSIGPKVVLTFIAGVQRFLSKGGTANPVGALSDGVRDQFDKWCHKTKVPLSSEYKNPQAFLLSLARFSVDRSNMKLGKILDLWAMVPDSRVHPENILSYLMTFEHLFTTVLKDLPGLTSEIINDAMVDGVTRTFRERYHIYNRSHVILSPEVNIERMYAFLDEINVGNQSSLNFAWSRAPDQVSVPKGKKSGAGTGGGIPDDSAASLRRAKALLRYTCKNCHATNDHFIKECTKICICGCGSGNLPALCPRFLSSRQNAASGKKANKVAFHSPEPPQDPEVRVQSSPISPPRFKNNVVSPLHSRKPQKTLRSTIISSPLPVVHDTPPSLSFEDSPPLHDIIIDTGATDIFVNNRRYLDQVPLHPSTASVSFTDGSSIPVEGCGELLGQEAHYLPAFDNTLLPNKFFDNINCALIMLKGVMHVIRLDSANLSGLASLIKQTKLDESHILEIFKNVNGFYAIDVNALQHLSKSTSLSPPGTRASPSLPSLSKDSYCSNYTYFTTTLSDVGQIVKFWHKTLGCASESNLATIVRHKMIKNLPLQLTVSAVHKHFPLINCESCPHGNLRRKPFKQVSDRVYDISNTCALDIKVWGGPLGNKYLTHSGEGLSLHWLDRCTGFSGTYLLHNAANIEFYIRLIDLEYQKRGHNLQILQCDKAFVTAACTLYFANRSLEHEHVDTADQIVPQIAAPHEHSQNGAAESLVKGQQQTVVKSLHSARLPNTYFGDCVHWADDVRNQHPSYNDPTISRSVAWGNEILDVLRTPMFPFGTRVKAHIPLSLQDSLSGRCRDAIYIGRAPQYKESIMLRTIDTNAIIVRRSFQIIGPYPNLDDMQTDGITVELSDDSVDGHIYVNPETRLTMVGVAPLRQQSDGTTYIRAATSARAKKHVLPEGKQHYRQSVGQSFIDTSTGQSFKIVDIDFQLQLSGVTTPNPRTPFFKHYDTGLYPSPPRNTADYEWIPCSELLKSSTTQWKHADNRYEHDMIANSVLVLKNALDNDWVGDLAYLRPVLDRLHNSHTLIANRVMVGDTPSPRNYKAACIHPESIGHLASFDKELESWEKNGGLLPPEIDIKDILPHLILQLLPTWQKKYEGLNFSKFKCRMLILGDKWLNLYRESTYSGMARMTTLKLFLTMATTLGYQLNSADVETAFLTTRLVPGLDAPYYVRRPPGVPDSRMPYISQPACFGYGHPRAGERFTSDYRKNLLSHGFVQSVYDPCAYARHTVDGSSYLLTIMDDATIASTNNEMALSTRKIIESKYKITWKDDLDHVAGIEITQDKLNRTITFKQDAKVEDLLNTFLPHWKSIPLSSLPTTPMKPGSRSTPLTDAEQSRHNILCLPLDIKNYQSKEGQLLWLTHTWLDIIYSQHEKSSQSHSPSMYDMDEIDRIIKYIALMYRTDNPGLKVGGTQGAALFVTVDSSYASSTSLKGVTGVTIRAGTQYGAFHAMCVNQPIATDSSTASEGVGAHIAFKTFLPMRFFLNEMGWVQDKPTRVCMDNVPYMKTILGPRGSSDRSRHILIRFNVVKEAVDDNQATLEHLITSDMDSDMLTKSLFPVDHHRHRKTLLGVKSLPVSPTYVSNVDVHT